MRTREEQIDSVYRGRNHYSTITQEAFRNHIEEAERRAEQRVRAEIARDSERLDWLCRKISGCEARRVVGIISCTGDLDAWRKAIDAAREVG